MATQWLRRAWVWAAASSALALAACGGGDVESQLDPARIVAVGDAFADLGQNGGPRYTVSDGNVNNWTQYVANAYGNPLAPVSAGGWSYATAHARVVAEPDAVGSTATPTIQEQVDALLARTALNDRDLVLVNAGTSDLIVQGQAAITGAQTGAQAVAAVEQAGRDLAAQVQRLVNAGATHVVVVGPYNLGRSPWAIETSQAGLLETLSRRFNESLLVALHNANLGDEVLYIDAALLFNLMSASTTASRYNLEHVTQAVCTSVDPGPGIGTGANQVNSALCTPSTIATGLDYTRALFADRVYPTPAGHVQLGDYTHFRVRDRW